MRTPSPRKSTTLAVALLAPAMLLSACGGSSSGSSSSSTTSVAGSTPTASSADPGKPLAYTGSGAFAGIALGGTTTKPTLTVTKAPFSTTTTSAQVVSEGTGPEVGETDTIVANAMFVAAKTGKKLESTFDANAPQTIPVKSWISGVSKSLVGKKAGSTILVAIAPQDGPDQIAANNPKAGIAKGETVLAYVQIVSTERNVPCTTVKSADGLPAVTFNGTKPASMKTVTTPVPTAATLYVVKEGTGPAIKAGQTGSWNYTGMLWKDGSVFDSSYTGGKPVDFPIGTGQVIPAWDKCLVGVKAGSQVVVYAPAKEAYGAAGHPPTIPANSPLVFAVELVKIVG